MFLATYNCSLYVINTKQEYSANRPEGMISQPKFTHACKQTSIRYNYIPVTRTDRHKNSKCSKKSQPKQNKMNVYIECIQVIQGRSLVVLSLQCSSLEIRSWSQKNYYKQPRVNWNNMNAVWKLLGLELVGT